MAHPLHITDVFFHAEIARIIGRRAGDRWLAGQVLSSISTTNTASKKSCGDGGKRAWRESEGSQAPSNTTPPADQTLDYECVLRTEVEIDEELADLVGLLFTDAAHAVLPHVKCKRGSSDTNKDRALKSSRQT